MHFKGVKHPAGTTCKKINNNLKHIFTKLHQFTTLVLGYGPGSGLYCRVRIGFEPELVGLFTTIPGVPVIFYFKHDVGVSNVLNFNNFIGNPDVDRFSVVSDAFPALTQNNATISLFTCALLGTSS